MCTFVAGCADFSSLAAARRTDSRRLRRIRFEAWAAAKAVATERPIPVAPAVMKIVLPLADREGLSGEIAAEGDLWTVRVKAWVKFG